MMKEVTTGGDAKIWDPCSGGLSQTERMMPAVNNTIDLCTSLREKIPRIVVIIAYHAR